MHDPGIRPGRLRRQGYLPVGIEVRIASRDEVDFNQSCAQLLASKFADCFRRLSLIRVWDDGNPDAQSAHQGRDADGRLRRPGGRLLQPVHGSPARRRANVQLRRRGERRLRQPLSGKHELQGPGERRRPRSSQRRRGQPDRHVDHQRRPRCRRRRRSRAISPRQATTRSGSRSSGLPANAEVCSRIRPATAPARSSSRRTSARRTRRARSIWRARRAPASPPGFRARRSTTSPTATRTSPSFPRSASARCCGPASSRRCVRSPRREASSSPAIPTVARARSSRSSRRLPAVVRREPLHER